MKRKLTRLGLAAQLEVHQDPPAAGDSDDDLPVPVRHDEDPSRPAASADVGSMPLEPQVLPGASAGTVRGTGQLELEDSDSDSQGSGRVNARVC